MNDLPDDRRDPLEERLRSHYRRRADKLRLPPMAWAELANRRAPEVSDGAAPGGGRWLVAASVAALVAGTTIGGSALLRSNDGDPSGAVTAVPAAATEVPAEATTPMQVTPRPTATVDDPPVVAPCPEGEMPELDVADPGLPNDVRIVGIPLPDATPAGYCVTEHSVRSDQWSGAAMTAQVYATCLDCDAPEAVLAVITPFPLGFPPSHLGEAFDGDGVRGRHFPAGEDSVVAQVHFFDPVEAGESTIGATAVIGWGVDDDAFVEVATQLVTFQTAEGWEFAGRLPLHAFAARLMPLAANLTVAYWAEGGDEHLRYGAVSATAGDDVLGDGLELLAWFAPDATLSEGPAGPIVSFPAAAAPWGGRQQSAVAIELADGSIAWWVHMADEPMTPDELAEIALSPAAADDPRWVEIAWESGNHDDAQG